MPIQGLRDTSNFATNERPENWRQMLLYLYPNGKLPLTALTNAMKESSTDDPVFHWWEKALDDRRIALHATNGDLDAPSAGTIQTLTLTADSNAITFVKNDILIVEETDEQMLVYSDPTSNTSIVVQRGANGTTPTVVDANGAGINPNLLCIGSAFEEGSLAPSGVNYDPTERYNYTQIYRRTMEITRTAAKTRLRTVKAVKEARRECLEYIGVDMERSFWLGIRSAAVRNSKPVRTTAGIYNQMSSGNISAFANGEVDMDGLETKMEEVFRQGSSEKMVFCGNKALSAINTAVRKNSSYQWTTGEKEFGMTVHRLTCPHGELVFKTHPLFTQVSGGTTTGANYYGMNTWAFIIDQAELEYRYLAESDLKYEGDLQAVGQDALKAGYIAECGVELHHPSVHFLWTQVNSGKEDI
jgi:hypothetical protein